MKAICVYCGSSSGNADVYLDGARDLAAEMVSQNIVLVYGGGRIGLMGAIADEVLRLGGQAIGVIPDALMKREVGHLGLTQLHVVKDMHERKAMMADLSDGFIAMPGGIGTLEELFEATTWSQLGLHDKPVGVLNLAGYYNQLMAFVKHMVQAGFLKPEHAALMLYAHSPGELIVKMRAQTRVATSKWLDQETAQKLLP
jgi:uncharacterized protein (TIGR00730 family)